MNQEIKLRADYSVAESADEILEYDYKATVIQKAFAFKTISFERAAK